MAKTAKEGNAIYVSFSEEEAKGLGLDSAAEYEFSKAKEGIWVLTKAIGKAATSMQAHEKPAKTEAKKIDEVEQRVIGYLKKFSLSERVEGSFEKKLSKEEQEKFSEMVSSGKIEKFKLNQSYKKAVYQLLEPGPAKEYDNTEKPIGDFTFEHDGFLVVRNENRAKELSEQLKGQIKDGTVKGTRSFSGEFFIIKTELLTAVQEKVLAEMRKTKNTTAQELEKKLGMTKTLIKIAIEFLKEDGQMLEKNAEKYQYIE